MVLPAAGRPGSDPQVRAGRGAAARPGGRSRPNSAVLVEPMESPARPDAAGPRGRAAEEVPPPGGESRCVGQDRGSLPCEAEARRLSAAASWAPLAL